MYLSRFEINTARRAARDLLASPQRLHAATMAAFPPSILDAGGDGRLLWRVDEYQHRTTLYLVSPSRPDLTHLVESVGWPTTQRGWDTRDYTPLLGSLRLGGQYRFRLTANPIQSRRRDDGTRRSRRLGHVTVAQQTEWLLSRAQRHGFTVPAGVDKEPDVAVRGRRTQRFTRQGRQVTLSTAVFEGRLEVTDPDLLRDSLTGGIGPAKGYGCGLLTLAPVD